MYTAHCLLHCENWSPPHRGVHSIYTTCYCRKAMNVALQCTKEHRTENKRFRDVLCSKHSCYAAHCTLQAMHFTVKRCHCTLHTAHYVLCCYRGDSSPGIRTTVWGEVTINCENNDAFVKNIDPQKCELHLGPPVILTINVSDPKGQSMHFSGSISFPTSLEYPPISVNIEYLP